MLNKFFKNPLNCEWNNFASLSGTFHECELFVSLFLVNEETRREREGRDWNKVMKEGWERKGGVEADVGKGAWWEFGGSMEGVCVEEASQLNGNEGREGCGTF